MLLKLVTGNGEWGMGNGEWGMGNGERETGVWECTATNSPENSTWRTKEKKRNNLGKCEEVFTAVNASFYWPVLTDL